MQNKTRAFLCFARLGACALFLGSCDLFGSNSGQYAPPPKERPTGSQAWAHTYDCCYDNAAHMVEAQNSNLGVIIQGTGKSLFYHNTLYTAGGHKPMTIQPLNSTIVGAQPKNRINHNYIYYQVPAYEPFEALFTLYPRSYNGCTVPSFWSGSVKLCKGYKGKLSFPAHFEPNPDLLSQAVSIATPIWYN